ncbi:MAG: CocE/NonD family hydrolase [Acidobacteriaceae bacterium]|nr:CocE/NonD family hydrolase [Acidobacteriaceae bacterium]
MKLHGLAVAAIFAAGCAFAQTTEIHNDIPASFTPPKQQAETVIKPEWDYIKRVEMVPMRDGTKLYTVIVIPKGAKNVPIILTRTPYNAASRAAAARTPIATGNAASPERGAGKQDSAHMIDELGLADEVFVNAGWIRVYQDVRGKYGSEGPYLMTPPQVGPYNATGADDTMDAYDTIDWLVKHVPESNGRVGMLGSSYEGYTVQMALLNPHPALKVALPESPMTDGWMGDDWFHYGAFRETMLDYIIGQTNQRGGAYRAPKHISEDQYTTFLHYGSSGDYARANGMDQLPYWKTVESHPAYDGFWQAQALDKISIEKPLTVPTMWLQGLWDQEDMWGAIHSYRATEPKDKNNSMNYLVMGPWFHSQVNREGRALGPFVWDGDTTQYFRREIMMPFFSQYLVDGAPKANTPPVLIYNTSANHWDRFDKWPLSCDNGCEHSAKPIYLTANGTLSWDAPKGGEQYTAYTSDPAKPVPYLPRPVSEDHWRTWLVTDQRFVDGRPDVLTFVTEPLREPLRLSGTPVVNLMASTSGTDSDFAVKLIDVYPENVSDELTGYELPLSLDIFRARYRKSFEKPEAFKPNEPELVKFDLPQVNHTFERGHRIMVQVQSTLFPLYDRNPQTFVPNIFDAKAEDYKKAEQRIWHQPGKASFIELPVVK